MALQLDHVVIAVNDLDAAIQDYRELGFAVIRGGVHANHATHNGLIVFSDGVYLELLAATDEDRLPDLFDFSPMLANGEGLAGFALRSDDLEAEASRLQAEGFKISDVSEGSREKSGRTIQWKLALIDGGFSPFLIQDITPREWRVPAGAEFTTHPNGAVGIPAIEFAVRDMNASWDRYTHLIDLSPQPHASNYRTVGPIILNEYAGWMSNPEYDIPRYFQRLFRGSVSQEEMLAKIGVQAEREREMDAALGDRSELLYAVHLIREGANNDAFTPDRTHGVRFHHSTGVPSTRRMAREAVAQAVSNTAAVLASQPEHKVDWKASLWEAARTVGEAGDADTHDFLMALFGLIDQGAGAVDALTPTVPEAYRDAWDQLAAHLRANP